MNTISQVCIQLEEATEIEYVIALHKEVRANLKKYSVVELLYMHESMIDRAERIGRRDAQELTEIIGAVLG